MCALDKASKHCQRPYHYYLIYYYIIKYAGIIIEWNTVIIIVITFSNHLKYKANQLFISPPKWNDLIVMIIKFCL